MKKTSKKDELSARVKKVAKVAKSRAIKVKSRLGEKTAGLAPRSKGSERAVGLKAKLAQTKLGERLHIS